MNAETKLDSITIRALCWKPGISRELAVEICQRVLLPPFTLWPDALDISTISHDNKNLVGIAWRLLAKAGVIKQTGLHRRSKSQDGNGRIIWEYELMSRSKAETFLRRNGQIPKVSEHQTELFAPPIVHPS